LDLLLKHSEYAAGRLAGLEQSGERVDMKVLLCTSLISFQGIIEYLLKFGGRSVSVRHDCRSEDNG
jgi:hypothetical protein